MPAEKFYPQTAVEDEPSDLLELAWHREYPGVYLTMLVSGVGSAIELDRGGLNRLIGSLRKARNQTFGKDS